MADLNPVEPGVQTSAGKLYNRRVLLSLVALNPDISVAELARQSGLSPQTVSSLTDELKQEGLLLEDAPRRGGRGQPARPLRTAPEGSFAVGVELGLHHAKVVMVNLAGDVTDRYRRDFERSDPQKLPSEIASIVDDFVRRLPVQQRSRVCGVGVAVAPELLESIDPSVLALHLERTVGTSAQVIAYGAAAVWHAYRHAPRPRPPNFVGAYIDWSVTGAIILGGNLLGADSASLTADFADVPVSEGVCLDDAASLASFVSRLRPDQRLQTAAGPDVWPWEDWEPLVGAWLRDAAKACSSVLVTASRLVGARTASVEGNLPRSIRDRLIRLVADELSVSTRTADFALMTDFQGRTSPSAGAALIVLFRRHFSREARFVAERL
jgi:predicted NBD/HSP70 family sugar kinase